MVVYHYSAPVDVVCGNLDEGWVAIEYDDGSQRDVDLGELKADGGYETIYDEVEQANEEYDFDFEVHTPLDVRAKRETVRIVTANGEGVYSVEFLQEIDNKSEHEFVTSDVMGSIDAVKMAYEQPSRLVYRNREELVEVEA